LQYLDKRPYYAGGRVKFTRPLAFLLGELGEAVFVCAAQDIFVCAVGGHPYIGEQVYHVSEAAFVQLIAGIVFRQDIFQPFVFFLNCPHRIVDDRAYFLFVSSFGDNTPPQPKFAVQSR
jgi:hypothetical protein